MVCATCQGEGFRNRGWRLPVVGPVLWGPVCSTCNGTGEVHAVGASLLDPGTVPTEPWTPTIDELYTEGVGDA